jgi:hypothetical protein
MAAGEGTPGTLTLKIFDPNKRGHGATEIKTHLARGLED